MNVLLSTLLALFALAGAQLPDVLDDPVQVDLLMLTTIQYEEGGELPEEITRLDGKTVKIQGYMATETLEGSTEFKLITDQCGCDGPPKVFHFVLVDTNGTEVGYRPEQRAVVGTFSVGEQYEDGFLVSLYRLKAESLE